MTDEITTYRKNPSRVIKMPKRYLQELGFPTAILLSILVQTQEYLGWDRWFTLTHKTLIEEYGFKSMGQIRKCKKELQNLGIVSTKMAGLPALQFYKININKIGMIDCETRV